MKTNYDQISKLLKVNEPFKGNSMSAVRGADGIYRVYSYSTVIGTYDIESGAVTLNEKKYSITTTKQQTLLRRAWADRTPGGSECAR